MWRLWQDYYRVVQQALAVLPAFASSVYYTTKASSSVAAALICGTPLLANAQLLAAYSYMSRNATFHQVVHALSSDGTTHMHALFVCPAHCQGYWLGAGSLGLISSRCSDV